MHRVIGAILRLQGYELVQCVYPLGPGQLKWRLTEAGLGCAQQVINEREGSLPHISYPEAEMKMVQQDSPPAPVAVGDEVLGQGSRRSDH